jgi:catechol 2,3-dioxygenase-like lactoylglutathione lyase family enzyme
MASDAGLVTLIPVKKMDRAIRFYTETLGAKVVYRGQGEMRKWWASLKLAGADVWFTRGPKWEKRKLAYQTLLVKDIRKYVARLKKAGVKFDKPERMNAQTKVEGPIAFESFGASAFFKDSEGNLLMVWQNSPPM